MRPLSSWWNVPALLIVAGSLVLSGCGGEEGAAPDGKESTIEKLEHKAADAVNTAADKTGKLVEKAGNAVEKAGEKLETSAAESAKEHLGETAGKVVDKTGKIVEKAGESLEKGGQKIQEAVKK